jgi:hypothetical protein
LPTIKRRLKSFLGDKQQVRKRACEELLRCYSADMPRRNVEILETVVDYQASFAKRCKAASLPELTSVEWWTRVAVVLMFFTGRY